MNRTFGNEHPIPVIVVSCCHSCKEFIQQFNIARRTLDAKDVHHNLRGFTAVSKARMVDFVLRKYRCVLIAI